LGVRRVTSIHCRAGSDESQIPAVVPLNAL